ncbi:hypothetical protein N431DRAFT_434486, partial [Stipitochalara longipes BDJ]
MHATRSSAFWFLTLLLPLLSFGAPQGYGFPPDHLPPAPSNLGGYASEIGGGGSGGAYTPPPSSLCSEYSKPNPDTDTYDNVPTLSSAYGENPPTEIHGSGSYNPTPDAGTYTSPAKSYNPIPSPSSPNPPPPTSNPAPYIDPPPAYGNLNASSPATYSATPTIPMVAIATYENRAVEICTGATVTRTRTRVVTRVVTSTVETVIVTVTENGQVGSYGGSQPTGYGQPSYIPAQISASAQSSSYASPQPAGYEQPPSYSLSQSASYDTSFDSGSSDNGEYGGDSYDGGDGTDSDSSQDSGQSARFGLGGLGGADGLDKGLLGIL